MKTTIPDTIGLFSGIRGFDEDFSSSIMHWFPIFREKGCEEKIIRLRGEMGWLRFHARELDAAGETKQEQFMSIIKEDLKVIKEIWEDINKTIGEKYLPDQYDYWVVNVFNWYL